MYVEDITTNDKQQKKLQHLWHTSSTVSLIYEELL